MSLVSINLLTYNASRFVENCLKSVLAQTYGNIEVLIIDNQSHDGTLDIAKRLISETPPKFPVRIIENAENIGFAAGHNLGIKESRGELILCLNQDVLMAPDFIEQAVGYFEKNSEKHIAALQAKLKRLDTGLRPTDIIDTTGLVIFKNRRIINRGQGEKDAGQFISSEEIFGADGAAPVYLRQALEDVKLATSNSRLATSNGEYFDEDFFMYKEDVDLAWRLRLLGWKTFYVPSAVAWHSRGSGESARADYVGIIRERLKIGKLAKYLSFKNQRLMQIKNEQRWLLFKHLFRWLPKEIASWIYVLLFEHFTLKVIKDLFLQASRAWQQRKVIMNRKRVSVREMERWFE